MIILPAIDIKEGKCVRLYQGDFSTAEQVAGDPLQTALGFAACGATWIHMVDLDGSLEGKRVNAPIFTEIAQKSGLQSELGGGVRDMQTVEYYIENGISRVILGTAAIRDPAFVTQAVKEYGDKIAVGIDAKNGLVAANGWTDVSEIDYVTLAKRMEDIGVKTIIYTDISRDGTLTGANTAHYKMLLAAVSCDIIASGGIKNTDDIKELRALNLYGAICGKSLYSGTLDLKQAIEIGG